MEILREEFGRGNEFAQKITYRSAQGGGTKKPVEVSEIADVQDLADVA